MYEHMFVPYGPSILHADADAFFASVEQRDNPRLRGRPTIVGSGVVMAASYEARAFGVRGAMNGSQARRLCPQAVFVEPRFEAYVEASKALFQLFRETAPAVEGLSLEEAFLDVSGLEMISGSAREIAVQLRRNVRERVGLAATVGVARTKSLAKMASRAAKPDGLLVIPPDRELEFLHPLQVAELWGVGVATATKLHDSGIQTVGELAHVPEAALISIVGKASGRHLHALAHCRDSRRVRTGRRRRSIGAQAALGRSPRSREAVASVLVALVDRVARRVRAAGRAGRTVVLRLRFDDFKRATRSRTLPQATATTATILAAARWLLASAQPMIERRGLTLIGVTVTNLDPAYVGVQLPLPSERGTSALDAAVDDLRCRFGPNAVKRTARGNDRRFSPYLAPDD